MNRRSIFTAFLSVPALAAAHANSVPVEPVEPTEPQLEWKCLDGPWRRRYQGVRATKIHPETVMIDLYCVYGWHLTVAHGEMKGLNLNYMPIMTGTDTGEFDMKKIFMEAEKFCRKHAPDIFTAE